MWEPKSKNFGGDRKNCLLLGFVSYLTEFVHFCQFFQVKNFEMNNPNAIKGCLSLNPDWSVLNQNLISKRVLFWTSILRVSSPFGNYCLNNITIKFIFLPKFYCILSHLRHLSRAKWWKFISVVFGIRHVRHVILGLLWLPFIRPARRFFTLPLVDVKK